MSIEQKIKDLQDQLDALKREVAEEPAEHKVWKPKLGEQYYNPSTLNTGYIWVGCRFDEFQYNQGRAFPTEEAAELFQKRERTLADMRRIAEKHGGEPAPGEPFHTVAYEPDMKIWNTRTQKVIRPGEVRFPLDTPAAQEAIDTLDLDVFLEG